MEFSRPSIWIVVPAFNEEPRLDRTLNSLAECGCNLVVVDDGSTDRTFDIALSYPVWVLKHVLNRGQGAALQTGIDFALQQGAEVLVTFDADGQHTVADLDRMVGPILAGETDVVLGSRFLGQSVGLPPGRRLILKAGRLFTRLFSGLRVTDTHNGFRAFSRRAAQVIRLRQDRMAHGSEFLDEIKRHGLSFREVPVRIHYSEETLRKGQSTWNAVGIVAQLLVGRVVR
jgi:glycosyltransferase involved in cell wall biosynthesis